MGRRKPLLTEALILAWADAHFQRKDSPGKGSSGGKIVNTSKPGRRDHEKPRGRWGKAFSPYHNHLRKTKGCQLRMRLSDWFLLSRRVANALQSALVRKRLCGHRCAVITPPRT